MKIKNILICGLVLLGMVGCDDFESVNTNPDSTNKVTSAMLATELLRDITTYKNGNGKDFIRDELLAKYLSWTEANDIDLAFNLLGGANYDALRDLRNASKMIDFATNDELPPYSSLMVAPSLLFLALFYPGDGKNASGGHTLF